MISRNLPLLLLLYALPVLKASDAPSFTREVAPLLVQHCVACHGAKNPQGEYQLHTLTAASVAGESANAPFVAGKPDESEWLRLITSTDSAERMPKDRPALEPEQIDVLRRWIAAGAKTDGVDTDALLLLIAERVEPVAPKTYPRPLPIQALALHKGENPDDDTILVGGYHEVTEWSVKTGQLIKRHGNMPQRITALRVAPDGRTLAVAGGEPGVWGSAAVWDLDENKKLAEVARGTDLFFDAAWSSDGARLAIAGGDRTVRIWNAVERKQLLEFEAHADWVRSVAWNSDGKLLVTASRDRTARVHRAADGQLLANFTEDKASLRTTIFAPLNEGFALSAGDQGSVVEWSVKSGDKYAFKKPKEPAKDAKKKEPKKPELTAEEKSAAANEKLLARANPFAESAGPINVIASYDNELLVAAGKTVRRIDYATREVKQTYVGATATILSIAVDPARQRIVAGDAAGQVYVWEAGQAQPQRVILAQPKE